MIGEGYLLLHENLADTDPLAHLLAIFAHSASAVTPSEKKFN